MPVSILPTHNKLYILNNPFNSPMLNIRVLTGSGPIITFKGNNII